MDILKTLLKYLPREYNPQISISHGDEIIKIDGDFRILDDNNNFIVTTENDPSVGIYADEVFTINPKGAVHKEIGYYDLEEDETAYMDKFSHALSKAIIRLRSGN